MKKPLTIEDAELDAILKEKQSDVWTQARLLSTVYCIIENPL